MRTCKICGETKPFTKGTWVISREKAVGRVCYECTKAALNKKYAENKDYALKAKLRSAKRHASNSNCEEYKKKIALKNKLWAQNNKDKANAKTYRWRENLDNLIKKNEASLRWARDNKARCNVIGARRRAAKLHRTPQWLTKTDLELIDAKYAMAQWLTEVVGVEYHVDHILPLQGELVSGLHIPSNMCVMLGTDNMSKGNKWEP